MNKVICDVCGTTFPETATRCPICGCAKQPAAQSVITDDSQSVNESSSSNTYSKGGRFAKTNVRNAQQAKRNIRPVASAGRFSSDRKQNSEPESGSKGLIAVVIILLLAIVMVVVYIGVKVFFPELQSNADQSANTSTVAPAGDNGGPSIPCTEIKLNSSTIHLQQANQQFLLEVIKKTPDNTTDVVKFESADSTIAAVSDTGMVTPVGYGTTTIKVTCGTVIAECTVVSEVGEPPATDTSDTDTHLDGGNYAVRVGDKHLYGTRHSTEDETYNITVKNVLAKSECAIVLAGAMKNFVMYGIECQNGCKMLIDYRGQEK